MNNQEIKQEANRLRKKADEIEYFATTLTYEHQKPENLENFKKSTNAFLNIGDNVGGMASWGDI